MVIGLNKSKLTALAMTLSFIFIGMQGDKTQASGADTLTYRWPVPDSQEISKEYSEYYNGIDITCTTEDTEIVAARGGKVTAARSTDCVHVDNSPNYCCNSGMGNYVRIEHDDGTFALYENLEYGSVKVSEGQVIEEGTVIGIMGSSGRSSQKHLHFVLAYSMTNTINTNPTSLNYKYPVEFEKIITETKTDNWKIEAEEGVNFRSGAGVNYDKIDFITTGTQVEISEIVEADGFVWGKTVYNGQEGWCVLDYAKQLVEKSIVNNTQNCLLKLETYGGDVPYTTYIYTKGEEIGKQYTPKKEGYSFCGWYTDENFSEEFNPKNTINADMILYAKWIETTVEGQ